MRFIYHKADDPQSQTLHKEFKRQLYSYHQCCYYVSAMLQANLLDGSSYTDSYIECDKSVLKHAIFSLENCMYQTGDDG